MGSEPIKVRMTRAERRMMQRKQARLFRTSNRTTDPAAQERMARYRKHQPQKITVRADEEQS